MRSRKGFSEGSGAPSLVFLLHRSSLALFFFTRAVYFQTIRVTLAIGQRVAVAKKRRVVQPIKPSKKKAGGVIPDESPADERSAYEEADAEEDPTPAVDAEVQKYKQSDPLSGHVRETIPDEALTSAMMWYNTCGESRDPAAMMWGSLNPTDHTMISRDPHILGCLVILVYATR